MTRTGTGDPAVDVAQVKIFKDGGTVDGVFQSATDTLIGSGFLNSSTKIAAMDITDQNFAGTNFLYIVYDISAGAVTNDYVGAQLSALTTHPTDNLTTSLPVPANPGRNPKRIIPAGDLQAPAVNALVANPNSIQEGSTTTVTLTASCTDVQGQGP